MKPLRLLNSQLLARAPTRSIISVASATTPRVNIPGVVTTASYTGAKAFEVNATAAGSYYFRVTHNATQSSQLVTAYFKNDQTSGTTGSGSNLPFQTTDFSSVPAGWNTLTLKAGNGVTIAKIEALKRWRTPKKASRESTSRVPF